MNRHSICCADRTPGCQQYLDWTVYNRVKLILILTKGKLLSNFLKPGSWQKRTLRIKAQQRQKKQYDCKVRLPKFKVGDTAFVYMPAVKACKAYKFARPFHGPYCIVELSKTGVVVHPVDQPQVDPI